LPDADVLAFRLGVAYASEFGHRGFSHSLLFAAVVAAIAAVSAPLLKTQRDTAASFVGLACASHGLLDMLTNGGHGVAYFWPFSDERFFFPTQVIEVSTLSLRRFLGPAGLAVLGSELRWVWLPAIAVAILGISIRRRVAA
jgi:inner membrane protein